MYLKQLSFYCIFFFCFFILKSTAQTSNEKKFKFTISECTAPIKIDGKLDDKIWESVSEISKFNQQFPYDTVLATHQTKVKVTFDKNFLYVAAICYQKNHVVRSLRRDFENGSTDIFTVLIDPFKDKQNGFYFAVSPYGVQKELLIFNSNEININWDNKWYSDVIRYDDRFEVEMAIPFKTLRYKSLEGMNTWNVNFIRNNIFDNERSCWAAIPRNFRLLDLSFSGSMIWDKPPPKPGSNISIIPFLANDINRNFLNNTPTKNNFGAGLDAKIAVTASMNLDLTVNPDFSQVEVDRQITDLSRFELFFPERRQFFLENNDLFSGYGSQNSNPFFSRRIGIYNNPSTKSTVQIPIISGARLSGRIDENWRIGFMNMQTAKSEVDSLPSINYLAASVQRKIGTRSNFAFLFVNKESFLNSKSLSSLNKFNRIACAEFNYGSANGSTSSKIYYHQGFTNRSVREEFNMGGNLSITKKNLQFRTNVEHIGQNYSAEVGYVPRQGIIRNAANLSFIFFPKGNISKSLNSIRFTPDYDVFYGKAEKRITDWDAGLFFTFQFQNNAELSGSLMRWDYTYLFNDFDPTNKYETGFEVLKKGTDYTYFSNRISFRSNLRDKLNYSLQLRFGNYFNGTIFSTQNSINYRWQPFGSISVDVNYTKIRLPQGLNNADFLLIGPRLDLTFSKSVFFTTFFQYNNQNNNININSRFQWRFKPVSDFFLVYTDNYYAQDNPINDIHAFGKKNRAIIAKFTYWFNL